MNRTIQVFAGGLLAGVVLSWLFPTWLTVLLVLVCLAVIAALLTSRARRRIA